MINITYLSYLVHRKRPLYIRYIYKGGNENSVINNRPYANTVRYRRSIQNIWRVLNNSNYYYKEFLVSNRELHGECSIQCQCTVNKNFRHKWNDNVFSWTRPNDICPHAYWSWNILKDVFTVIWLVVISISGLTQSSVIAKGFVMVFSKQF